MYDEPLPISTDDMLRARLRLRDDGLVPSLESLEQPEPALYGFIACSLHCLQIHLGARGIPPLGTRDVVGEITEAIMTTVRLRKPISDVFRHGKTHASKHPCEKPVALLRKLVEAVTVPGEAILDPFSGSGATAVAAKRLKRQVVGIEIAARWHAEAVNRLSALR